MPRGEAREDRPVRNGAMAIHLGELGRLQLVREWSPADPAARTPSRRSRDGAVPGPSARLLAGQRHAGAPVRDCGPVPRRDPGPRPGDDRLVGGEPPRDVAPRRTGGRDRRHAAELHGGLGPRPGLRRHRQIAPAYLSDRLAQIALPPKRREEILARTRSILHRNYAILADWIRDHGSLFSYVPPTAGAICFLRYALGINSSDLAWRLLKEKSTLIVPGDHFGMDGYIRIGMGDAPAYLTQGLDRIDALLRELRAEKGKA